MLKKRLLALMLNRVICIIPFFATLWIAISLLSYWCDHSEVFSYFTFFALPICATPSLILFSIYGWLLVWIVGPSSYFYGNPLAVLLAFVIAVFACAFLDFLLSLIFRIDIRILSATIKVLRVIAFWAN